MCQLRILSAILYEEKADVSVVQAKNGSRGKTGGGSRVTVSSVKKTNQWALRETEFAEGLVGGKSRNLAVLR